MTTFVPEEPPAPETHFGYGVVGVGVCGRCHNPRTIIVHSAIHTDSSEAPYCHSCIYSELNARSLSAYESMRIFELDHEDREKTSEQRFISTMYQQLAHEWEYNHSGVQHTRQEILDHEYGCQACAKFFHPDDPRVDRAPVEALGHDGRKVTAHSCCTKKCCECEKTYMVADQRGHMWANWFREYANHGDICSFCVDKLLNRTEDVVECNCSRLYDYDDQVEGMGDVWCPRCGDQMTSCDDCGEDMWEDDSHYCPERQANRTIKSWDFRPSGGFTFHGTDPNNLFLGFELEVEGTDTSSAEFEEMAEHTNNILEMKGNRGFLKYDGSLENGFEIVTQPHTLEEYEHNFPWSIVRDLQQAGFRSWDTDTCGFHVHISKQAFGWNPNKRKQEGRVEAHVLRFLKLIYDNRRYVQRLSGRSSDRWASFGDAGNLTRKVREGYQNNSRYSAVNVSNRDTFEIRVFKGSMRIDRIKANLEFVHSVAEYTRNLSVSPNNNTLQWAYYRKWLVGKPQYAHLTNLLDNLPRSRSAESEQN